jgi:aspartate carbamoyltransferase catalytic subunit
MPGLLRAAELDRSRSEELICRARMLSNGATPSERLGSVVGLMFFEDSLRTRVGFEVAASRLGAATTNIVSLRQTAQMAIPETLEDSLRSVASYCDVICLRHPNGDAFDRATRLVPTPVLNCGNGSDEHPTQALVDLLAVAEARGVIDGARVAMIGDLRHMRVAHSLIVALSPYENVFVRCISPPGLTMPAQYTRPFCDRGGLLEEQESLELTDVDVVYVAGLPRTPHNGVTIAQQDRYRIELDTLGKLAPGARVLCPLPRVDEIATEVDGTPHARYFEQSAQAVHMRTAILEQELSEPPAQLTRRGLAASRPNSPSRRRARTR